VNTSHFRDGKLLLYSC